MVDYKKYKAGITVKEPFDPENPASYEMLDMVLYPVEVGGDGCAYVALVANQGVVPGTDPTIWTKSTQAGQSIYDLAVKYGHFDGTEEEFEAQYQAALAAANSAAAAASATDASVQAAEAVRVSNETARETAEVLRSQAESNRAAAEDLRVAAESARALAEGGRASAESARVSAESERASAETARQTAEGIRDAGEQARVRDFAALETDMETAIRNVDAKAAAIEEDIEGYEANEAARVTAEAGRASAESARVSAESGRVAAESGRVSAESGRVSAETARATAESGRASAETGRVSAEQGRVNAESARVAAETARETQASSDHTAAVAATEAANTAAAAADAAREGIQEDLAQKANIDGYYENMGVGTAKNLEGRDVVTESFLARTTGGNAEVSNGPAQMQGMEGESVKWNQLVNTYLFKKNDTSVIELTGNTYTLLVSNYTNYTAAYFDLTNVIISGHIYYHRMLLTPSANVVLKWSTRGYSENANPTTFNLVGGKTNSVSKISLSTRLQWFGFNGAVGDTIVAESFDFIDLTDIFGAGNEPATVEEFEQWLSSTVGLQPYYAYDPGSVVNVKMTGLESLGRNLLDPATGKAVILGKYSDVYGNYYGITGTHGAITFTDAMGNSETITPDSDGKFLLETPGTLTVATPGADCSVFLWWDGSKTDYSEYERNVANLDVTHIYGKKNGAGELVRVWPTGVPGFSGLRDGLKIEDGQTVAKRYVQEVDMGTLTWYGANGAFNLSSSSYAGLGIKIPASANSAVNAICIKYPVVAYNSSADKTLYASWQSAGTQNIFAKDAVYDTAAAFTTAVTGIPLYYELATPETYTDLVYQGSSIFADGTPVVLPVTYQCDNWSIERVLPLNEGAFLTAAPTLSVLYSLDAVETLDTHTTEIANLYEGLDELDAKKPEKNGVYPNMTVGSALALAGNNSVSAEYTFRPTPNSVAPGLAMMDAIKGKSVVWNQLVQNGDFGDGTTGWTPMQGTFVISNNVCTLTIGGTSIASARIQQEINLIVGHKYFIHFELKPDKNAVARAGASAELNLFSDQSIFANVWNKYAKIATVSAASNILYLYCNQGGAMVAGENCQYRNAVLFDLTLMFGAGNEPSSVAEFEALYPLPYYDYNAGTIINNAAEAIETVGFNQWDEEWEVGRFYLTTGENDNSSGVNQNCIRSKKYIPIFGGQSYHIKQTGIAVDDYAWVLFFDAAKNVISGVAYTAAGGNNVSANGIRFASGATIIAPNNASYIRFYRTQAFGGSYANDICINFSDPARNGTYEPYKKYTLPLGIPTLTGKLNGEGESVLVCPDGLKSAGTVYDELIVENGYAVGMVKRVGQVDLGTLEWAKEDVKNTFYVSTPDIKNASSSTVPAALLCAKYQTLKYDSVYAQNNGIAKTGQTNNRLVIYDSAYASATTAADFKTAMSGVMLNYELAEPQLYVLDEPFYVGYQQDGTGSTERRLPDDTASSVIAPFAANIVYPIGAVQALQSLPTAYISTASMDAFLSALGTAMGGTWTKTWSVDHYTFSFTPSN